MGGSEARVHHVLDSRRLHGEWFDFGSDDPGRIVRAALLSLDELAWLKGLSAAVVSANAELGAQGRPVTKIAALDAAQRAAADAIREQAARRAAEQERHDRVVTAGDYLGRPQAAAESMWRTLYMLRSPCNGGGGSEL